MHCSLVITYGRSTRRYDGPERYCLSIEVGARQEGSISIKALGPQSAFSEEYAEVSFEIALMILVLMDGA
jgi:hypothetical protein